MVAIKKIIQNKSQIEFWLRWAIRIIMLVLLIKLTFFNRTVVQTEWINADGTDDELVIIRHRVNELTARDSAINATKDEKILVYDTVHHDSVVRFITKWINANQQ